MASFDPIDHFGHDEAPPRPTTPPVRRGFLLVLLGLSLVAGLVYGIPFVVERAGYAYEAGRARAAEDALSRLEKQGKIANASSLFRLAAARVSPAVVNIRSFRAKNANDPPAAPNLVPVGIGSGVVIDASRGLIVTNHHVINHGEQFFVRPSRGGEWPAKIVGMDPATDLAVLQVKAPVQVEAEWGSSETLAVGDWVLAIGSPFNLDQSVSAGIVSATERSRMGVVGDDSYENFIQTDAAVNPGNSGGPLIDLRGKIVGINTAISTEGGGANGIGLAIPVSLARKVAEDLINKGRVSRGYLGVILKDLSASDAAELKVPDGLGAYIDDLDPEGPAQSAGLQRGDVVVKLDGQPITDFASLRLKATSLPIGSTVPLDYIRGGKPASVPVTIAALPILRSLGVRLRDVKGEGEETALIADQVPFGSPAHRGGLEPGSQVLAINDKAVKTRVEAEALASEADPNGPLIVQVLRPGGKLLRISLRGGSRRP